MLEIIVQIIDDHMTKSSSHQHSQKYANHEVIEMLLEKRLQAGKFCSEYILFRDPIEKKISRQKSDEVEI
jgi:hypothetical protein